MGGTIGSAVFMMPAVMAPYGSIGLASLMFATLGAVCVAHMFGSDFFVWRYALNYPAFTSTALNRNASSKVLPMASSAQPKPLTPSSKRVVEVRLGRTGLK